MNKIDEKKWAAIIAALGACRGMLYSVKSGDFNMNEIEATLDSTALSNVAGVLGLSEADLAVDTSYYLSQEELDKIRSVSAR